MGPKKTLERIKYSFFWEGLRANVKKFCESCKECQLTRSVHCDASDYGVGCFLTQQDTEGIYRPIAFASQNSMLRKRTGQASRKRPG
ncbi:hypothetical protein TNCV_689181 [Trichonephila clavipes]|nr:hypothetical protein TNCV_689181 [Trichonephila clavipes]